MLADVLICTRKWPSKPPLAVKSPQQFHRRSTSCLFDSPGLSGPILHLFLFDFRDFFFEHAQLEMGTQGALQVSFQKH